MSAKQTLSASLVVLVAASPLLARAEPDAAPRAHPGEDRPDDLDEPTPPAPALPAEQPAPPRRPTGRFALGAGYGTDDGFAVRAAVAQDSLFGTGKRLALDASLSARHQWFAVTFEDPHLGGSDLRLRAVLATARRRMPGFVRGATGGSLTLAKRIAPHVQAFVGYRLEDVTVELAHPAALARGGVTPPRGALDGRIGAVRTGLAYDTTDAPFLPARGTTAGVALEVADRGFGSAHDFARLDGWLSHHRALGPFTLHLGGTFSTVRARGGGVVPLSERLHFDGSRDVRGLAPGELGPFDPSAGLSLGGDVKATGRAELELPLFRRLGISVVGFLDAGAIYDRAGRGSWGLSRGIGLVWRSPIGPLRFDWAFRDRGDDPRFVFGLGSLF